MSIQFNQDIQKISHTVPVLGITMNEDRWLIPMSDIKEILPVPQITPVFLTHSWFLGVINIRGAIYGLSDLSAYLDQKPAHINMKTRIFLLASYLGTGYALLVENILGIRDLTEFTPQPNDEDKPSLAATMYHDRQSKHWCMLDLPKLVQLNSFRKVSK